LPALTQAEDGGAITALMQGLKFSAAG